MRNLRASRPLTQEQAAFLKQHGVSRSQVFNAAGLKTKVYQSLMKEDGYLVASNVTPCKKAGHTLRWVNGDCAQCNPAGLAFIQRHDSNGIIYVARSAKQGFVKIGTTRNLQRRKETLRSHSYAGADDWVFVYHTECDCAGRIEKQVQASLSQHKVCNVFYERTGITQMADEIFRCSTEKAIRAVVAALEGHSNDSADR